MGWNNWGWDRVRAPGKTGYLPNLLTELEKRQRADDRAMTPKATRITEPASTFDWTFEVIEVGTGSSWTNAAVDLAPGGWTISINVKVSSLTGGGLEGVLPFIIVEGRPNFEGAGTSLTRSIRNTEPVECTIGYTAASGVDFSASVYASFTKVFDL